MFGFKKKKKNQEGTSNITSATSAGERKSSRGSILPFGKKSHKSKTILDNGLTAYRTDVQSAKRTKPVIDERPQIPVPKNGKQHSNEISHSKKVPGFQVLGQLASDLEALQLRRQSEEEALAVGKLKEGSFSSTSSGRKAPGREPRGGDPSPAEEWGEQEVLSWLEENDLGYFVDLFDGCGIDGDYLLQITEQDLVELEVDDSKLRERFLSAVNELQNANDVEADVPLPGLEADSGSDSEWESLEELDEDQEQTTGTDKIASDQMPRKEHDLVRPPTGFSLGHHSRIGKAIDEWSQEDVTIWLETVGLERYANNFRNHNITGSKLKNIDMSLLDQMKVTNPEDREKLLSSLYDLIQGSTEDTQVLNSIVDASDYDKQKYLAAVQVMQSHSPRVQVIPAEPSDRQDSTCSTSSESDEGKRKKKKGSITKLRDAFSGMSKNSPSLVRVWTDVGKAKDKPIRLKMELDDNASAKRLVKLCLESMDMIEDPRLYCIAEVCVADDKDHSTVSDRELEDNERPMKVQRKWRENMSGHFELRQRTAQGGVIKLVLKLPGEQPKGKLVALSLSTPTHELIPLALLKYGMIGAAPMDFCLLEVDKNGDLHPVDDETLLLQQESHAYVLCMRESLEELTSNNEGGKAHESGRGSGDDVRVREARRGSGDVGSTNDSIQGSEDSGVRTGLSRQGSRDDGSPVGRGRQGSKVEDRMLERPGSRTSLHSSQSSEALAHKVDGGKLTQLEQQMASIEQSLQPKVGRSVSWSVNVQNKADKKAGLSSRSMDAVCPDYHEGGDRVAALEEENSFLHERLQEFEKFEEIFGKLKATLSRLNTETSLKLLERRRAANPDLDSLPRELAVPMFQLEGLTQEVETKQARVNELREESENADDSSNTYLKLEEASLTALKLEQTRLLCAVEVAMADYQLSCEKRKELAENRSLITILPPNKPFTIVSATVNAGAEGYQFELGSLVGRKGIYINKCDEEGTMRTGDRVIEINNHCMFTSSVAEGNTKLNSTSKVKLVLLRDMSAQDASTADDLHSKLASTNKALEEASSKNEILTAEIAKLESELAAAKAGNRSLDLSSHQKSIQHRDLGDILENLDDDVPLWEAVKSHTKSEILQVFQEEVQEANRQKQYLDQLYTLMLERAPDLLEQLEQDFGAASEISGDEEFC